MRNLLARLRAHRAARRWRRCVEGRHAYHSITPDRAACRACGKWWGR